MVGSIIDSFMLDPNQDATTSLDSIKRRRLLAEKLMQQGSDFSPVQHWTQGAARVAQGVLGALDSRAADNDEKKQNDYWMKQLGFGGAPEVADAAPAAAAPGASVAAALGSGMPHKTAQAPADLMPHIEAAAAKYGIPKEVLVAQIAQESGFDPNATGKAGEVGLMQIMPSTAKDPGFGMKGVDPAMLRDPAANIDFGAQYLKARGGGDLSNPSKVAMALKAYNGGGDPNYVQNVSSRMAATAFNGLKGTASDAPQPGGMMGAAASASAPAQASGGTAEQNRMLAIIANPNAPANVRAAAQAKLQLLQKDTSTKNVDLGTEIGVMDAQGNIVRRIPKSQDPLDVKIKEKQLAKSDDPEEIRKYNFAVGQGYRGTFDEWSLSRSKASAPSVNIDQKAEGQFEKSVAEGQAKLFNGMAEEGIHANAEMAQVQALRQQMQNIPGGFLSAAQGLASNYGIKLGPNASNIEAAEAIISKLIPTQRAPGSGTVSDADLAMFKSSLPRLSNTPQGNALILDTMQGLSEYKGKQAEIATAVLTGEMSRKDAMKALRELPSPLAKFKSLAGEQPKPETGSVPTGVDPNVWKHMTPEERKLWN